MIGVGTGLWCARYMCGEWGRRKGSPSNTLFGSCDIA